MRCPLLMTPRLLLRPYRMADFPSVHAYGADPEVSQYMSWGPNTEAQTREFLMQAVDLADSDTPSGYHFAVIRRSDGTLLGGCNLHHTDRAERTAMIGYTLNQHFWRQGFATEAANCLLSFGVGTLGLHRIVSWCDPDNIGSWRVMEKIGMKWEGREREAAWFKERWHDWVRYAILDSEWAEQFRSNTLQLTFEDANGEIGRALIARLSAELAAATLKI